MTLESLENTKKNEPNFSVDLTEDSQSLIEDYKKIQIAKQTKSLKKNKVELLSVKQLPTLFFIIFIIVLAMLTVKLIPFFTNIKITNDLSKEKMKIKFLPEILGEQSSTVKLFILASQFLLSLIIICLTSLIRQRIAVPELIKEKWRNYGTIIASILSVSSMVILLFYNKESLEFSKNILRLVDNIVFFFWMLMSFVYCLTSFSLLEKLELKEISPNIHCRIFKSSCIFLMGIQIMIYLISIMLISFYNPVAWSEKFLINLVIMCMFINSLLYLLCNVLFIYSLKYDLYYVNLNLQIQPDLEYFIDLEGSIKSQL